jgi:hypothetical protein
MKTSFLAIFVAIFFVSIPAHAVWERVFKKDDFTDKESVRYSVSDRNGSRGMFLILDCTETGNISFVWQISDESINLFTESGEFEVNVRVDSKHIFKEAWKWAVFGPFFSPAEDQRAVFLSKLKGAKKLALKIDADFINPGAIGIFDITGFDKAYAEVKTLCNK